MRGIILFVILAINAQAASRGFWYQGYRHADNPFVKKGRGLWVSPKGDDAQAGSKDQPWRTLGKARKAMVGGDVLNILPGLYFFNCQFGPAGTNEDRKTVWRAAGKGRVVIAADEKFTPPYWSLSDNLSIQGLWLGGSFMFAHKAGGGSYSSRNSEIIGCTFFNGNGFAGGPAYNWLFQDNRMVHLGKGTHGHSAYMAGGVRHDLPWNSRNLRVLGNTLIGGEGYALHCWHSPVSATLAGNFTSGNFWSVVLQGPNHSCHHNVFWKPRGNMLVNDEGTMGFNAWLPARLRRFDHLIFGSPHPVWQKKMPPMRSLAPIEKIYLLHDARLLGVPDKEHILLTGKPWTGKLVLPKTKEEAARIPAPANTTVRPAFFPHTASEIDAAVATIQKYFRDHNPQQIAADKSGTLENLFDKLEVQYTTMPSDYALFPPMAQDKDDGTYGVH